MAEIRLDAHATRLQHVLAFLDQTTLDERVLLEGSAALTDPDFAFLSDDLW